MTSESAIDRFLSLIRQDADPYDPPNKDDPQKSVEEERAKKLKNDHDEQKIELQKMMFFWIKWVVSLWLLFIVIFLGVYLLLSTFTHRGPILDKEIIMTLLATTTINILGLPYVITRGLFG